MKIYSGIGSRNISQEVFNDILDLSKMLSKEGFLLRTGGSTGSDEAFLMGSNETELYLPWEGFNGKISDFSNPSIDSFKIAKIFHPNWKSLSLSSQKLHARNVHIILGENCDSPSSFVIAWTPDGVTKDPTKITGGTGQGIRIANHYNIPVINLNRDDWTLDLKDAMNRMDLFQ